MYTMVMSWQAQLSPNISACTKGVEHPPQGSWCLFLMHLTAYWEWEALLRWPFFCMWWSSVL